MNKYISCFFLLSFLVVFNYSFCQVSEGGEPLSFSSRIQLHEKVPFVNMPSFDFEAIKAEARKNSKNGFYQFGHSIKLEKGIGDVGEWTDIGNGDRIWRVGIRSEEAYAINLIFSHFNLPEGAKLYVYSADRSMVLGAFTSKNNQPDHQLGIMPVRGSEIILEYFEPSYCKGKSELVVGEVVHSFEDIFPIMKSYGFGQSGSCNMNVNCTDGMEWEDQKRAVTLIVTGNGFCSGALVNNTAQDKKPYILTANHCLVGSSSVSGWVFVFNFESMDCSNSENNSIQSISGAELIANYAYSDFALLEMNSAPPDEFNVFYSGWSRTIDLASSTVGIHHPQGDIKKISFDDNSVYDFSENEWRVQWDRNTITEPGSSGSPLFDHNKRIIGQSWRGASDCENLDGYEFYGKFYRSWEGAGTASSRLKNWLDPIGSDVEFIDGLNGNDNPVREYCRSSAESDAGVKIDQVVFGEINQTFTNSCRKYSSLSDLSTTIAAGETVKLEVLASSCDTDSPKKVKAWIDWNGNYDFENESELVFTSEEFSDVAEFAVDITAPEEFMGGHSVKMRIIAWETMLDEDVEACGLYSRGETQDYTLNLLFEGEAPVITSFAPLEGTVGTEILISGLFDGIQTVTLGGIPAEFNLVSATEISAIVPEGFRGGAIKVFNPAGSAESENELMFVPSYCLSMASTSSGAIITNVEFGEINNTLTNACRRYSDYTSMVNEMEHEENQELTVSVGSCDEHYPKKIKVYADWNSDGDFDDNGEFLGTSPSYAQNGTYTLPVTVPLNATINRLVRLRIICWETGSGSDVGPCDSYNWGETQDYAIKISNYEGEAPTVSDFFPQNGFPGTEVKIYGNFQSVFAVTFNGLEADFTVISSEEIHVIAPQGDIFGVIAVHNPAGVGESEEIFTTGSPPSISSFSPDGGSAGTIVQIIGEFESIESVKFNGINSASFEVVSSNEIRAVVPEGDTEGQISVRNPAGVAVSEEVFSFIPVYCSSVPVSSSGARIDSVKIGSFVNKLSDNCRSYSSFTHLPKEAFKGETLPISVSVGTCRSHYTKRVIIYADWDADGLFTGAGEIIATSPSYEENGTFNTYLTIPQEASVTRPVLMRIICWESGAGSQIEPCGSFSYGETQDYLLNIKEYVGEAPVISSISPEEGTAGSIIVLEGHNFEAITSVAFGSIITPDFHVESGSRILVTVPSGATTGSIIVTNPAGSGESDIFYIFNYCNSRATSSMDTKIDRVFLGSIDNYSEECAVYTDFTNAGTDVYPGQELHLQVHVNSCGNILNHAIKVYIDFDKDHHFDEHTELIASGYSNQLIYDFLVNIPENVPSGIARMRLVCVEGADLQSVSACGEYNWGETEDYAINIASSSDRFPLIRSISPENAVSHSEVIISGDNFNENTTVYFNGVLSEILGNSSGTLTVRVPPGTSSGPITIVSETGSDVYTDFKIEEYCISEPATEENSIISAFNFNDFEYYSSGNCASYQNFTGEPIRINKLEQIPLQIQLGSCGAEKPNMAKVYIDWNGDKEFDETEEVAFTGQLSSGEVFESTIYVPADAQLFETRMRIVSTHTMDAAVIQPCGIYAHGETQDYSIVIEDALSARNTINSTVSVISYPNPFSSTANFRIKSKHAQRYRLEVQNILGETISVIFDQYLGRGEYNFEFKGDNLPSGTYLFRLSGEESEIVGKILKY